MQDVPETTETKGRWVMKVMTWEQKFAAITALCNGNASLQMRAPGNWYIAARGRVMQKPGTASLYGRYGNGATPEEAVNNDWETITNPSDGAYIVMNAMSKTKARKVRWNGFMWEVSEYLP